MAVTFAVDPAPLQGGDDDSLVLSYGWAHYHAFIGGKASAALHRYLPGLRAMPPAHLVIAYDERRR